MKFFRRNRKIVFVITIMLCIALICSSAFFHVDFLSDSMSFVIVPVEKFLVAMSNFVTKNFYCITNIFEVENENINLKNQIEKYKLQADRLKLLENENQKLNKLLGTKNLFANFKTVVANVVAKNNGAWFSNFIIDKGLKDGLQNKMVVISADGLVGKITDCKTGFSKVSSIISPKSSVSVKNFRTDDLGFAKGDVNLKNNGLCCLEFLNNVSEISQGDRIVTSQLSEIFPPGILVGYVQKIISDENQQQIILEPAVDFKNLDCVLVITNSSATILNENFDLDE